MEGVRISLGTTLVGTVKMARYARPCIASIVARLRGFCSQEHPVRDAWSVSKTTPRSHSGIKLLNVGTVDTPSGSKSASSSSSGSYHTVDAIDPPDLTDTVGEHGISHTELGVHVTDGGVGKHGLTDVVCVLMLAGLGTHAISSGKTSKCTNEPHLSLVHAHS